MRFRKIIVKTKADTMDTTLRDVREFLFCTMYFPINYMTYFSTFQVVTYITAVITLNCPSFSWRNRTLVDQGLLVIKASRSPSDTPHPVGLLWKSDQPDAEKSNLTTHNTDMRQTFMPPPGFEHAIPAGERPQTHATDRAATGTRSNCP